MLLHAMTTLSNNQIALSQRLESGASPIAEGLISTDGFALGSGLRSEKDDAFWKDQIKNQGRQLGLDYQSRCREEAGASEGMPFTAALYGEKCLGKLFEGHQTLHRMWLVEAEMNRVLMSGLDMPEAILRKAYHHALGQNVQNLKAISECLRAQGQWKGSWTKTGPRPSMALCTQIGRLDTFR